MGSPGTEGRPRREDEGPGQGSDPAVPACGPGEGLPGCRLPAGPPGTCCHGDSEGSAWHPRGSVSRASSVSVVSASWLSPCRSEGQVSRLQIKLDAQNAPRCVLHCAPAVTVGEGTFLPGRQHPNNILSSWRLLLQPACPHTSPAQDTLARGFLTVVLLWSVPRQARRETVKS